MSKPSKLVVARSSRNALLCAMALAFGIVVLHAPQAVVGGITSCEKGTEHLVDGECMKIANKAGGYEEILTWGVNPTNKSQIAANLRIGINQATPGVQYSARVYDKADNMYIMNAAVDAPDSWFMQVWEDSFTIFHGEWQTNIAHTEAFAKKGEGKWGIAVINWSKSNVNNALFTFTAMFECPNPGETWDENSLTCSGPPVVPPPPLVAESAATCGYSSIGFNPWERWQLFASADESIMTANVQVAGRIAAHDFSASGTSKIHTTPEAWLEAGTITGATQFSNTQFSVSLSGTAMIYGQTQVISGVVEAVGNITASDGAQLLKGAISAGGNITIKDNSAINEFIWAYNNVTICCGSPFTSTAYAGGNVTVRSFTFNGKVVAAGFVDLVGGSTINGNVMAGQNISLEGGCKIGGDAVSAAGLTLGPGTRVEGKVVTTIEPSVHVSASIVGGATVDPNVVAPEAPKVALSVDLANAAQYFKAKSLEWSKKANCVVSFISSMVPPQKQQQQAAVREATAQAFPNDYFEFKLHGKVNFYTVDKEEFTHFATRIIVSGNPYGILVLNIPGDNFAQNLDSEPLVNVSMKSVWYKSADGNLAPLTHGRVIYNFFEATNVDIGQIHINPAADQGKPAEATVVSILAPNALVRTRMNTQLNGTIIAKNFFMTQNSQFGLAPFGMRPDIYRYARRSKGVCLWNTL